MSASIKSTEKFTATRSSHHYTTLQQSTFLTAFQNTPLLGKKTSSMPLLTPPPSPLGNQPLSYQPRNIHDASSGRRWSYEAIDHFIICRIHGGHDWEKSGIHLNLTYEGFDDTTEAELERFWNLALLNSRIRLWWSSRDGQDATVQRVLREFDTNMVFYHEVMLPDS